MYADGTLGNHSGQKHSTLIGNDRKDLLAVAGNSKRDTSENVHCTNTVRLQLFNILLLDEVVQWLLEILVNSLVGKDGEKTCSSQCTEYIYSHRLLPPSTYLKRRSGRTEPVVVVSMGLYTLPTLAREVYKCHRNR